MEAVKGMFARSLAGHDKNKLYVIIAVENEYVYLVDGRIRKLDRPKKKKLKHVQMDSRISESIRFKINSCAALRDEDIKRAIKLKDI